MQHTRRHILSLIGALLAASAGKSTASVPAVPPLRIVVEPFEVRGLYADRGFVNRTADWQSSRSVIGPPSLLFGDALVDMLRVAYGRQAVVVQQASIDGDISLRPVLQRLERVRSVAGDQALLAIEFAIHDGTGVVLGKRAFRASLPAGSTPAEYLAAQAQLLARACEQSLALLDQTLPALGAALLAQR